MAASTSKVNFQNKRLITEQVACGVKERISNLPENILHHILSFLPTIDAVGTSILSTRWKYLWTSIPNLDIVDWPRMKGKDKDMQRNFTNYVDRVFLLHDVSNINRFSFTSLYGDAYHLNVWISTAVRRNVRELILNSSFDDDPALFPSCVFSCESLCILKITSGSVIELPTSICLPNLKILNLHYIIFCHEKQTQRISFSLPVLKEFVLEAIQWKEIDNIEFWVPKLGSLYINNCELDQRSDVSQVEFYAESLVFLNLESFVPFNYSLHNLSSLVSASIDVWLTGTDKESGVVKLLKGICNARDLKLTDTSIEVLSTLGLSTYLRALTNLIHLKVAVPFPFGVNKFSGCKGLIEVLCKTPNIEYLYISDFRSFAFEEHSWTLAANPDGFLPRLKLIELGLFNWSEEEMRFIRFFLSKVKALEEIKAGDWYICSKKHMDNQLQVKK